MKLNISISGPTCAGKTTFSDFVCNRKNIALVAEDIPNSLFSKFTKNPYKYCFELQKTIILSRADNYLISNSDIIVIDRTASEDFDVFVAMHRRLGFLSDKQVEKLSIISQLAEQAYGKIDATIFINSDISRLKERMRKRPVPNFMIKNIELQLQLYRNWKNKVNKTLIEIDNSFLSKKRFMHLADIVYETIYYKNSTKNNKSNIVDLLSKNISLG